MSNNGDTGGVVVTSVEHTEGHETMDEKQISDVGIRCWEEDFLEMERRWTGETEPARKRKTLRDL